jgi:predicted TIM-barrel fold metal-dependent hydrolase
MIGVSVSKSRCIYWEEPMRLGLHLIKTAILLVQTVFWMCSASADTPLIIDTHAHINFSIANKSVTMDFPGAIDAAVSRMDRAGIRQSIFLPQPSPPGARNAWENKELKFALEKHPGRIALIGGGGSLNPMIQSTEVDSVNDNVRREFRAIAERIAEQGVVAYGEITAHHLSLRAMGPQHGYQNVPPDHPLLLLLADIASEKGIPIDLHIDLIPDDMDVSERDNFNENVPSHLAGNLAAFERLLSHNRKALIIWAHAGTDPLGTRTVAIQRTLLRKHPNLHMSIRIGKGGPAPVLIFNGNGVIKPPWFDLLQEFSDRFTIGSDYFHGPTWMSERGVTELSLSNYRALLKQLPNNVASAIGHENAERIYRLPR